MQGSHIFTDTCRTSRADDPTIYAATIVIRCMQQGHVCYRCHRFRSCKRVWCRQTCFLTRRKIEHHNRKIWIEECQ
jgi:hypothetical protein